MDADEVRKRAASGEDSRTELKHVDHGSLPNADDVSKALVAFANSGGGDVFFGVDDDGSITGIGGRSESDKLQLQIADICAAITPPLAVRRLAIDVDGKLVVVARVPEFLPGRPFRGKSKYFIRDGNRSREGHPDELKRLLTSALNLHYLDEQAVELSDRSDLDDAAIAELLRVAFPSSRPEQTNRYLTAMQAIGNRCTDRHRHRAVLQGPHEVSSGSVRERGALRGGACDQPFPGPQ
jgi:ATP-dependent DNA helicase RecG